MGLFDFLNKNQPSKNVIQPTCKKSIDRIIQESDKAIEEMQKADSVYNQDGDIEKRIKVYEKYLMGKPLWNSFNFSRSLVSMYLKSGRNNEAWSYLNQLIQWSLDPESVGIDVSKVRYDQFKILKSEKKYSDALIMLVSSYVTSAYAIKDLYFNKEKFIKEAKTTAKGIGMSYEDLLVFADDLEKDIKRKKIKESKIKEYCREHFGRTE